MRGEGERQVVCRTRVENVDAWRDTPVPRLTFDTNVSEHGSDPLCQLILRGLDSVSPGSSGAFLGEYPEPGLSMATSGVVRHLWVGRPLFRNHGPTATDVSFYIMGEIK